MRPLEVFFGIDNSTALPKRRHANLAPEHGFVQRDRQIDAQIAAVDLEERMRRDG